MMSINQINISQIKQRFKQSDIAKRMARGTFWSFSGTAFAKFIVLIAGIICARILGKLEYGELGMVRSTITVFVSLGTAGLGLTATKFISEYRKDHKERIPSIYLLTNWFSLVMGILISLLIFVLAPVIAEKNLESPYLTNDIRFGGILLFFTILNGVQNGILSGFEDFKSIAFNTLYGSIAESILMCVGAYYWGVTGAIIGYGTGYIVLYIANKFSIRKLLRVNDLTINASKFIKEDLKILYKFSIPATLSSLMVGPIFWIVKSMLVRSDGYGQLAIYEAADQWKIIILFIPSAVSQVVMPILSGLVNKDKGKFWKVLKLNMLLNGGIALLLTIVVTFMGNFIMNLYGKGFDNPYTLIILCLSTVFTAIATVIGLSISSRGKMWIGFLFNLIWGLMVIGFSKFFLNCGYGATGLALAISCAYFIHAISQYIYLRISFSENIIKANITK